MTTADGENSLSDARLSLPCVSFMGLHVCSLCRQHMRNCTLTGNQLFQDILSYSLSLIGCTESSTDEDISVATGEPHSSLSVHSTVFGR